MTADRARKAAIRARMAAVGERYSVAARHVADVERRRRIRRVASAARSRSRSAQIVRMDGEPEQSCG